MRVDINALRAILDIQDRHNLNYVQQDQLLNSSQLENILIAEHYMRRDQVIILLLQEKILEPAKKQ